MDYEAEYQAKDATGVSRDWITPEGARTARGKLENYGGNRRIN